MIGVDVSRRALVTYAILCMIYSYYVLIHPALLMSTISIPLTPELEQFITETTTKTGLTKADVVRQALRHYAEAQAVERVLLAAAEPSLDGELADLVRQLG